MLSVRIVTTDHYMAPPVRDVDVCYSEFRGTEVKRVPVMRVYGATEAGQKTCMHLHGIFPYLYVPYDGSEPVQKYLRQLASSVDKAVNIGMGKAASTTQHVYKITLVTAVPFYGYHDREQQFLKIYLYNPFMVKRVADLLLGGAIMNKILQPHESHIPYNLQAFIDYNLYGMNMIKVAAAKFRQPEDGLPAEAFAGDSHSQRSFSLNTPPQEMHWDLNTIPSDAWLPLTVPRQSSCELEVDVVAADVLNRIDVGENIGTNPGLAALWDDERQRRREHADDSHLSPPSSPGRGSIPWTDDEAELQERLRNILIDLQPYISEGDEATPDLSQKESATPSSQVESHHSLTDDLFSLSSQDTVILEADANSDAEPIVNETSILRVVSSSQSFQGSAPKPVGIIDSTQDQQLAHMLAAMGEDEVPCSQAASQALSRVATLEDADSILSQTSPQVMVTLEQQAEEEEQEERDMLDLSQSAWGEDVPEPVAGAGNNESCAQLDIDMEGMDQSWNSSQWVEVLAAKGEDEQGLPQYDGPADDKLDTQSSTKKRLGMLGATLPTFKVKTISPGAFSITAKTNEDTLITFTSSTKMHPIRTNKAKPASKQSKPGPASRTSPIAAPQSLRFDLRASELQQMSGDTDDEHSSAQTYKKRPQEGVAKAVGRVPGKNSPKEASRASDAFVELSSRSHSKQTSQHKAAAGRESRAATAKPNSKPNVAPKRGSTTRRREGRDNIFASLASELHPTIGSPKQKAKSPPKDTANTSSSKPSTVNDAHLETFMKKSRARLSSANTKPKGSAVAETTIVNKNSDKKTPRINSKTIKQKRVNRTELTSEDEFRESENEFEGKRLLIPRRRSSDSSSENEVPAQPETMKAPSCPQKKPNGEMKRKFIAPTIEDESEKAEKASEVSDDQMSLRVDPDPESDHEMWDQTGCDDLPVIVDLPADPMSISDCEQQDDGPLTYEEHSTVIVSKPSRKSPKARKMSGSQKKPPHGHDSKQRHHSRTSAEKDPPPTHSPSFVSKAKLKPSSMEASKTSPVRDAHYSSDAVVQPKPEDNGKSCISLAERKRKLSLKRLLKKRENALEQLRRHSSHSVSDTDSYTSTEMTFQQKTVITEPAVIERSASQSSAHSVVLSPQQNEASLDLFSPSDSSPQDHFSGARGRGRARRGGKSPAGSTSPATPLEKIGKRSPRGRRGRGRGQRPALQSHTSMDEQDSVWFSASNYINYYNGLRVCLQNRKTRHMAEEASNRVRVLKTDCQKYHLTDVGQEKLDLHNMNPYELIHSEEYHPPCDKRYRTYAVDLSYQKKSPGRPPGWKKQQDASGSRSEMLTTPGEDISMEIIDISSLTAEASMLKRCEQQFSSMEQSEGDFEEGKQSRSIHPMEEELVKAVSGSPASLTNTSLSSKPDDHSASLEPVFLSTRPGPKSSKRRLQPSKIAIQPCLPHTVHTSKSSELSKSTSVPSETSAESTNTSTPSSNPTSLPSAQDDQSVKPATQSSKYMSKSPLQPSKQEPQSSKPSSLSSEQIQSSKCISKFSKQESQSSKLASLSSERIGQPVDPVAQPSRHTSKSLSKSSKQESQSSKSASLSSAQSGQSLKPATQSLEPMSKSSQSSEQPSQPSKPRSQSLKSSPHSPKAALKSSKQTVSKSTSSQSPKAALLSSKHTSQPSKHSSQSSKSSSKHSMQSVKPASERSNSPQVSRPAPLSVPTSAAVSAKGEAAIRSHPTTPRQPLLENQQSEAKGDMSVVDFSLLENPIDNDVVAILSTDADPHHQLHTPPLVMDAAKGQSSPHTDAGASVSEHSNVPGAQGAKAPSAVLMHSQQSSDQDMSSDDDGQNTVDYTHDETLTETDLYSDSNAGMGSPSASNSDENSEVVRIEKTLRKQDSVSTEDSLTNDAKGHSSKKRHTRRPSLKMKFKKVNSESSSEAPDNQTESGEERRQRKRRKVEQIDHYRFRAKRATVDYSSEAFAHIYKLESTKSAAPKTAEIRERKRKLKPKDNIQYIIINKFKGYRSMRVLLEKLDVDADEVIHLSDFKRRKKQKRRHISQTNTQSFGTVRQIVSDVPHENQSDPLWEEQIERLGGDDGDADNDDDDDRSGGSSDDESSQDSTNAEESRPRKGQYITTGKGPKKRVMSYHKRLSNAFCTKTRRPKRKSEQTKIWNTLSLLHDATVAQLTSPNATYDDQVDKDHKQEYVDVMYKLALFSPPQSEHGGDSPPQPLSPASPREEQEAAIQQQDEGPRKKPSAAYHTAMLPKISQLHQSSLDDSQGEIALTKSPVHLLKSSARSSAANSPSGSDPEAHFGSRQALSSEYNSSGMNPNNTGSPYAVKETIVHFNPSKSSLFNKGYSKDSSPPDLGPPTLHQMSPHSLSSNSGSPPELLYQDRDLQQQQKQQSNSSTPLSDAYSNFFGTMPAVTNNEKKSSTLPFQSHPQLRELTSKSDKVEKRSSSKVQEKTSRTAKSSHRSLSLKKSRPGASPSSAVDLTKDDAPSLPIVGETAATASARAKSSTQTVTHQTGKEATTIKSHSASSAVCVEKKEYKHQHTKKKVLARFGIDMQASKEKDRELALRKSLQKEVQPSEEKEMPKRPEIIPEEKVLPGQKEKDAEEESEAHKQSDTSKDNQRSQPDKEELQQSSDSSSEEEYACIRSQTPPQSPGISEPIKPEQKENPKKTKKEDLAAKTENSSSDDDEEEETDEEETRKPEEVALSPIRSPSPVPFNTRCDAAVPMVPIATPRHPGLSDYQMPPPGLAYSAPNWPTKFDEPTAPQDVQTTTTLKSSKTKDVPPSSTTQRFSLQSEESLVNQQKGENDVSNRLSSKADKPQTKDKLQFESVDPSQQEKNMSPNTPAEQTAESDADKTAESDTEMDASSKTSEESEDDTESVARNCQRTDSPIRSPSPELKDSPTKEESKEEGNDVKESLPGTLQRGDRDQNLSKSDLFSPSNDASSANDSPVIPQSEERKEQVNDDASTDSETEEDSEEDEDRKEKVVCSPIRSLSPPASPSNSKVEDPEASKAPVFNIPTNISQKHMTEDNENESSKGVSADSNSESSDNDDDDKDTVQNCERLSIPIRSPSPTIETSPVQNTGKTAVADAQPECEEAILSSSELFSPEPQERLVPSVDESKARGDKDDNQIADEKKGPASPEMKKKDEISKSESEGSSEGSEEETEDEGDVRVPAQKFSPIRSPSPPCSPPQENDIQSKEDNHVNQSSSPTSKDIEDDTHKPALPESSDDSGEETEEEDLQTVQMEIFSPIRSPSPPHLSPAEPVKDDGDQELSSKPPEIPVSIMGSPNPQERCAPPLSPSTSPKRPSPERAIPEIRVVKMAGPMNRENLQSRSSNVIGNKRSLSVSPQPSPHAAPSELEEGEVRTDDETQEECELNDPEAQQPIKETEACGEVVQNEEKEDGELTETSTCRSSPPPSPITISSTDDLSSVKRTIGQPEIKTDQSVKEDNSENIEESKTSKTGQTTPSETNEEEIKETGDKEECAEESSDEDSEEEEVLHKVRYSSPIRSPSPAGEDAQDDSSKAKEDAAHVAEGQCEDAAAAAQHKSSSESEYSDSEPSRMGTPRSIQSPSPIQSPDHETDADPKVSVEESIQSPSPIQSPDQGVVSLDRTGQPAVIPLTIDTSVGDPRMKRLLMHPVPSPVASSKCTDRHTGQHGSDHSEDEAEVAARVDGKRAATGKETSGRGNAIEGSNKETHSSGHGRDQNEKAADKDEGKQPSHPSEMSPGGKHPPRDTYRSTKSNDVQSVITPVIAPPSRKSVSDSARQSEGAHREAFYSDPQDAQQQRPREIGGRVLKIHSPLVSALPELEPSLGGRSLKEWQSELIAEQLQSNSALSQQSQGFNMIEEMVRNPQLKASLLGNQQHVITPCRPPPSHKQVAMWMKAKALLSKLNQQEIQDLRCSKKTKKKSGPKEMEDKQSKTDDGKKEESMQNQKQVVEPKKSSAVPVKGKGGGKGKVKNPNFTGMKRKLSDSEEAACTSANVNLPPSAIDDVGVEASPALADAGFKTPARRKRRSASADELMGSRTKAVDINVSPAIESFTPRSGVVGRSLFSKRRRSVDDSDTPPIHSTPRTSSLSFTRRVSFVESTPSCTPIKKTQSPQSSDTPSTSTTPPAQSKETPPAARSRRRLVRSATPPPTGATPPYEVRRRRSITPPPSVRHSGSPSSITPTNSNDCETPRQLRRLSTNTQSFLRRLIQSSQNKNPLITQLSLASNISQIEGATPKNTYGFKVSKQNIRDAKALHEYTTLLSVEVLALARGDMMPNPDSDAMACLFYSLLNDIPPAKGQREVTGAIVVDPVSANQNWRQGTDTTPTMSHSQTLFNKSGVDIEVVYVRNEQELIETFIEFVKKWDPDMLVGWEVQQASWGYLLNRAAHLSINLCEQLSRIQGKNQDSHSSAEKDEWGADTMSEIHIAGRIVLNLWRILRHEVTLNIYTFENVMYHVLHRRVAKFSYRSLTTWWQHRTHLHRWRTIEYFVTRVRGNLQIMDQIDLLGQTSEFARVFGIEFYHVLSRGSQYRVESMMLRIAKPMNFTAVSPGVQQRARQKAPECIPLTLEPESKFYTEPVVVLDFQSLYPSIMIAYNYCYSTCLGRLGHLEQAHEGDFEFGCSTLNVPPSLLKKLEKDVNICPNGVVFVKQHVRKGIISGMVEDILRTRLMVKKSMKQYKEDKTLQRLLHARQLGLKLIANVTFGYTAASYSGRMACVEVGDSIVRKARETLERAIHLVENTARWNARVVYGDTDSLFICLPGRTKDEAFKIGQNIADEVTADNPKPVKLKFEKVYLPCVLQTKKRYVGFMYETPDQVDPVFDAKGIETVRRDGCGAVSKILERSLKILFTSRDMSLVKQYVQRQILKLLEGRADIQDFIFAKEYRGMAGYKPAATVPALEIAKRRLAKDRCSEPRVGERVPYVIVYGTPGLPLIQLVREPQALLTDPSLRLNATYYITKAILPPLSRAFGLMGVDVQTWYTDLPRINRIVPPSYYTGDQKKGTISQYFTTLNCPVCEETMVNGVCPLCHDDPQRMAVILNDRIHQWEHTHARLSQVCYSCMRTQDSTRPCCSIDCPVLFRMLRATRDVSQVPHLRQIQQKLLKT